MSDSTKAIGIFADRTGTNRALVYVEGDVTWSSWTDSEGNPKKSLNIVQRTLPA